MRNPNRILSVHQPNFIPWIGFFHKIAHSNVFIILDEVQIPRGGSVANRNYIKGPNGKLPLIIPLSHAKGSDKKSTYSEVLIADNKWRKKALTSIRHSYSKCEFFGEIFAFLESCFAEDDSFCEMNIRFIRQASAMLHLDTEIIAQSSLNRNRDLQKSEMIIEICRQFDSRCYLSGQGASAYNDADLFRENGVKLTYQNFEHPVYPQLHGEFISHLSIIDALFNIGFEGVSKLVLKS